MKDWPDRKPKGVTIFKHKDADKLTFAGPNYLCIIKSKGRNGAGVRSRLMRAPQHVREPILKSWFVQ